MHDQGTSQRQDHIVCEWTGEFCAGQNENEEERCITVANNSMAANHPALCVRAKHPRIVAVAFCSDRNQRITEHGTIATLPAFVGRERNHVLESFNGSLEGQL